MVWKRGLTVVVLVGVGVATACSGRSSRDDGVGAGGRNGGAGGRAGGAPGGTGGATGGSGATGGTAGGGGSTGGASGRANGGRAGSASAGRSGGGGRGGGDSGGFGGEHPRQCPDDLERFCSTLAWGDCPSYVNGAFRAECPLDADYATYEECDDGVVRYRWSVGGENTAEMLFWYGALEQGSNSDHDGLTCSLGSPPPLVGCRSCTVCGGGGEGGQSGAGGEGGAFSAEDCVIDGSGFVSLP